MKLEELEEQLKGILQRTEEIKKEIDTLKNQNKPVTFIPEEMQEYYYPDCSNLSGVYAPNTSYGNGSGVYQVDAFETVEQCQIACDYLNMIMPMIKLAIENNETAAFGSMVNKNYDFVFQIAFNKQSLADKARELYEKYKGNQDERNS